jgi:hypothetical protein
MPAKARPSILRVFLFLFRVQTAYFRKMSAPKRPRVNMEYYEQPKTIGYFEAVINSLRVDLDKAGADTSFSAPDLAYFIAHFQKFQLDHLGKEAADKAKRQRKKLQTGVPYSLFSVRNLNTQSPLYFILKAAYKFKSDYRIVDWRFDAQEEMPTYLHMIKVIQQALADVRVDWGVPHIWFDETVEDHRKTKLNALIEDLGGK